MPNRTQRRRPGARGQRAAAGPENLPNPDDLIPAQRERRDRIVRVALRMLEHSEYEDIQMRDVAEQAEVALGTVYRYFGSKEHLFAAVLVSWSDSLQTRVQSQPLRGDDIPSQLLDLFERVIEAFERLPQFFRLMVVIETTTDPYARKLFGEFAGHTHDTFAQPLQPLGRDDSRAVIEVLMAVLGGVLRAWALNQLTSEQVRDRVQRAVTLIFSPAPKPQRRPRGSAPVAS